MSGEPVITLVGNLTADAEIRFLPSGVGVATFTVASTPRVKDGDNWVDGEPMFVRCSAWRQLAENVVESLSRGTRVIVSGRLKVRSWEKDGVKRTGFELDVDAVGPELRHATAKIIKAARGSETQRVAASSAPPPDDPWAPPAPGQQAIPVDDEPPF